MMKKYRTFIISMTLFVMFLISIPFMVKKGNRDYVNLCTHTDDYDMISGCNWAFPHTLTPQQYYDMFYYNAKNYPKYLRDFLYAPAYSDAGVEMFASNFSVAYNTCEGYSSLNQCNLHDKEVFKHVWSQCIEAGIYPCTDYEYRDIKPPFSKEQILLFSKLILHTSRGGAMMVCYGDYLGKFYHQLTDEQKSLLDKRVITICEQKYE